MTEIDHYGFAFTAQDLLIDIRNDAPDALRDHTNATIGAVRQLILDATVEQVSATLEGACAVDPCALNLELVLSNGKRVNIMGEWKVRISQPREAAVVA